MMELLLLAIVVLTAVGFYLLGLDEGRRERWRRR